MHKAAIGITLCLWLLWQPEVSLASQADAWPGDWPMASPESQGFNSTRLQKLSADLMAARHHCVPGHSQRQDSFGDLHSGL
jgi:hypothetical protein